MASTTRIPARFNGPPASGNGGYSCGVLAAFMQGPCRVRLHVPPPLEAELTVRDAGEGRLEMFDGDTLVGSATPASEPMEIPAAPTLQQAGDALTRFAGYHDHPLDTCFVCGPNREAHDGLELFTGPVSDWQLLASTWTPASNLLDDAGNVRPEVVWAALDCPGYFAAMGGDLHMALLGELYAELRKPVPGNQSLVVYAWPISEDGRKLFSGAAIANADGEVLACARSTWIVLQQ
jgi:hypothetical protein